MSTTARDIVHASATTHLQLVADYDDAAATANAAAAKCDELETDLATAANYIAELEARIAALPVSDPTRIAELETELAAAYAGKATLAGEVEELKSRIGQLSLELLTTRADLAACQATQPPPNPLNVMTTDVPEGWRVAYTEAFDVDCAKGGFRAAYAPRLMGLYPRFAHEIYNDTRRKNFLADPTGNAHLGPGGIYTDKQISVADGICTIELDIDQTTGISRSAALLPIVNPRPDAAFGDAPAMIWEVNAEFDLDPSWKVAWMLWPITNKKHPDGELDSIEFAGAGPVVSYWHWQDGVIDYDQKVTPTTIDPRQPHTYRTIWRKGISVQLFIDGVPTAPVYTNRIPKQDMHLVLQCETRLTGPVDKAHKGIIRLGGVRAMVPA
jgi:uncharacterized small protein (DUF1192 family)